MLAARIERLLPVLLGSTIVAFACGSSTVDAIQFVGFKARWVALVVLALAAARVAVRSPRPPRGGRTPLLLVGGLLAVAFVSAAWSVDPRLSVGRAGSLGFLFAAAVSLAIAASTRPELGRRLLVAVVLAAGVAAAAGLVVLAVSYHSAVQPASAQYGARYRGLGLNPNTIPSLLAVAAPLTAWWAWDAPGRRRLAGIALFVLLDASIVASGSRGAILAVAIGLLVLVLAAVRPRRRLGLAVAAVAVLTVANLALAQLPNATASAPPKPPPGDTRDAQRVLPLEAEIGRGPLDRPRPKIERTLVGGSGRSQAWRGAVRQAADRPLVGYGFGTEEKVFVDRYYYFAAGAPENSYIGTGLQLGAVGLAVLVVLALWLLVGGVRRRSPVAAAAAAVLAAGLALGVTQSYLLSVGNVATASVWVCGFLGLVVRERAP